MRDVDWGRVKRGQAHDFDRAGNVASGYGKHGAANACWAVAAWLRQDARREDGGSPPAARFDPGRTVTVGELVEHAHRLLAVSVNAEYDRDVMASLIAAVAGLPADDTVEIADMIADGVPGQLRAPGNE